eukprot:GHVQ01004121.1.p1 GENE.GHVQ01004121.1~~GHVQ01004121.1.p1  ORF type:complete len:711 (+),score=171.68 GHVQ01004121.1:106-2133(+)
MKSEKFYQQKITEKLRELLCEDEVEVLTEYVWHMVCNIDLDSAYISSELLEFLADKTSIFVQWLFDTIRPALSEPSTPSSSSALSSSSSPSSSSHTQPIVPASSSAPPVKLPEDQHTTVAAEKTQDRREPGGGGSKEVSQGKDVGRDGGGRDSGKEGNRRREERRKLDDSSKGGGELGEVTEELGEGSRRRKRTRKHEGGGGEDRRGRILEIAVHQAQDPSATDRTCLEGRRHSRRDTRHHPSSSSSHRKERSRDEGSRRRSRDREPGVDSTRSKGSQRSLNRSDAATGSRTRGDDRSGEEELRGNRRDNESDGVRRDEGIDKKVNLGERRDRGHGELQENSIGGGAVRSVIMMDSDGGIASVRKQNNDAFDDVAVQDKAMDEEELKAEKRARVVLRPNPLVAQKTHLDPAAAGFQPHGYFPSHTQAVQGAYSELSLHRPPLSNPVLISRPGAASPGMEAQDGTTFGPGGVPLQANPSFESLVQEQHQSRPQQHPSWGDSVPAHMYYSSAEDSMTGMQEAPTYPVMKLKKRCVNWPDCSFGDKCRYIHPREKCVNWPNCPFGTGCFYIHPEVPCKFGAGCLNQFCAYSHPDASTTAAPQFGTLGSTGFYKNISLNLAAESSSSESISSTGVIQEKVGTLSSTMPGTPPHLKACKPPVTDDTPMDMGVTLPPAVQL